MADSIAKNKLSIDHTASSLVLPPLGLAPLGLAPVGPFIYEGRQIRVITDQQGDPWFVAADLLATLALDRKALERLDADEKGVSSIHTPGGEQSMTTVNEPGLYSLVLSSRKKEAQGFKRWLTREVLPAIRRNGHYSVPGIPSVSVAAVLPTDKRDTINALLLIGQAVAQVPGVKAGIAMAATLTCIEQNTGLATETLKRALPATEEAAKKLGSQTQGSQTQPICSLNATELGKLLGLKAKDVNQHLVAYGLQIRNDRGHWELTAAGQRWGEALPFCRAGHSGQHILWNPAVIDQPWLCESTEATKEREPKAINLAATDWDPWQKVRRTRT